MKQIALKRFINDESGASLIEYGLLGVLIGIVCIATLTGVGDTLNNELFGKVNEGVAGIDTGIDE